MKLKKCAIIVASIMILSTVLLVGCGKKNPYIGHWAEDEGSWIGGHELTINEDGTAMDRLKDPTAGERWGKWTETDNGISITFDEKLFNGTEWRMEGCVDEEGFLLITTFYDEEPSDDVDVYRRRDDIK